MALSDQLLSICESSLVSKETLQDTLTLTVSRMGERANDTHRVTLQLLQGRALSVRAWVLEADRPKSVLAESMLAV